MIMEKMWFLVITTEILSYWSVSCCLKLLMPAVSPCTHLKYNDFQKKKNVADERIKNFTAIWLSSWSVVIPSRNMRVSALATSQEAACDRGEFWNGLHCTVYHKIRLYDHLVNWRHLDEMLLSGFTTLKQVYDIISGVYVVVKVVTPSNLVTGKVGFTSKVCH